MLQSRMFDNAESVKRHPSPFDFVNYRDKVKLLTEKTLNSNGLQGWIRKIRHGIKKFNSLPSEFLIREY